MSLQTHGNAPNPKPSLMPYLRFVLLAEPYEEGPDDVPGWVLTTIPGTTTVRYFGDLNNETFDSLREGVRETVRLGLARYDRAVMARGHELCVAALDGVRRSLYNDPPRPANRKMRAMQARVFYVDPDSIQVS